MNNIIYVGKHALTMAVSRHIHDSWELIYCTGGDGELIFEDKTYHYSANDVSVIPPYFPHSNRSDEGFTNYHVNLIDTTLPMTEPFILSGDENGFLLNAFQAAFYYYSSDAPESASVLPAYGQLLATMVSSASGPAPSKNRIVTEIENNILQNYADCGYDLNEYLRSLPFSAEYLKKLFKKSTGLTPLQFLTEKRLEHAAGILSTYQEKGSISETASLCGFRDPLYFSRMFKRKYGVSPKNYIPERPQASQDGSDRMKIML